MSGEPGALDRLGRPTATGEPAADRGADRAKVAELAQQFEAMFLVQILRQMRESAKWDDESADSQGTGLGFGADTLYETIDTELARQLGKAGGFGLAAQLQGAFERAVGGRAGDGATLPVTDASVGYAAPAGMAVPAAPPVVTPSAGVGGATGEPATTPAGSGVERLEGPQGHVTSAYGWRRDPFSGASRFHRGVDIRAAYGEDVQSAGEGRVVFAGEQRGYGTTVVVEHAGGVRTRYAHLSASIVQEGEAVSRGQTIGQAGRSGRATGTHLHFEVIADGKSVDPAVWGLSPLPGGRRTDTAGE